METRNTSYLGERVIYISQGKTQSNLMHVMILFNIEFGSTMNTAMLY